MAGRLLSFKDYIGGADNVFVKEMFPGDQIQYTYDFGIDVSGYSFSADWQSIVLSSVAYDRVSGDPSFSDTTVSGYFNNYGSFTDANVNINTSAEVSGQITLTIPENRYTGNVTPDARTNVVGTVFSFEWETDDTPVQKQRHRYLILERFDPRAGKPPTGNIEAEPGFVSLTS